jgi:hypothetical protein
MDEKRTEKHEHARNSLPDELKPIFDDFVADYKFHGTKRYGSPFVSYIILADMIRAGWRLAAEPVEEDAAKQGDGSAGTAKTNS